MEATILLGMETVSGHLVRIDTSYLADSNKYFIAPRGFPEDEGRHNTRGHASQRKLVQRSLKFNNKQSEELNDTNLIPIGVRKEIVLLDS